MNGPLEEKPDVEQEYRKTVSMLRDIKGYAKWLARSGNPGRRSAGLDLLAYIERQREGS